LAPEIVRASTHPIPWDSFGDELTNLLFTEARVDDEAVRWIVLAEQRNYLTVGIDRIVATICS
jgi:hypothetical protein